MRIPRFWAAAEGSGTGPQGERLFRRAWGWSMSSTAEALTVAHEQLRSALANVLSGTRVGGYYPRAPLREPILDEVLDGTEQALAVTRNRYGAEVLNTDRLLIADIDLPELEDQAGDGWLRRLFRRRPAREETPGEPPVVQERVAELERWAAAHPDFGVIVYRTASGLRVFVTGVSEPTTSAQGESILVELGADPIYRELCRTHGTFRARLTPKPWRLPGFKAPGDRWPFADSRSERRFQRWLDDYEAASRGYAVCRRLAAYGRAPSVWEAHIIQRHDDRALVQTVLPLA
ncbi:hypothetical protein [Catelliglobosispora koreensis]|uniref:hypothetical protein n=1 Tax=Catelliglobosispora koreensis TaxID=129052 RepID=UPI00036B253B|nr:hypothetical protein [Catelliglobosispora koreensis]